jgi:hypothetical protein
MTQLRINMTPAGTGDTTPPSISIIFAQKVGSTGWTLAITTDEGDGALYYLVTQGTATKAQVLAGATQPVTQSGEQIISGSGLSPSSTYRVYVLHQDAAGNDSPVLVSNPFTTDELGSGSGSVAIQIMGRSDLEVAPEAVWFRADVTDSSVTATNAIGSYDESFHKLTYIWDFGDPGAASDKLTNVPLAHNDLNKAYGKHAAHVYTSPGTYTVTCTVYAENRTLIGVDTQQVIVGDPDTLFTGNRTILLDPAGAGDSAAYPGSQVVTTVNQARNAVMNTAGACRVLVKRGITITTSDRFSITNPATTNLYVGTYGSGARPVMNMSSGILTLNNGFSGDVVFTGLDFYGPYDELTASGATATGIDGFDATGCPMKMVDDCTIDGYKLAIHPTEAGSDANWAMTVVNNTLIRNAGNYSCFARGQLEKVAFLGASMTHNPLAAASGAQIGNGNSQGNVRFSGRARAIMSVCELFSKFGWSVQAIVEEQSTVRNNTGNSPEFMAVYDRVVMEGGWEVWNSGDNQSTNHQTNNILLEKCLLLGASTTRALMQIGNVGITVRNGILIRPNSPYKDQSWQGFVEVQDNNDFQDPNARLSMINCTYVQAQSSANHSGIAQGTVWNDNGRTFNTFENVNGVLYTPNNTGVQPFDPVFEAADLVVSGGGTFNPRYAGFRQRSNSLETQFATPDDAVKLWRPTTGSPLIGAATGVVAYDDYLGNVRPASADMGAVQNAL